MLEITYDKFKIFSFIYVGTVFYTLAAYYHLKIKIGHLLKHSP